MIWKKEHLSDEAKQASAIIQELLTSFDEVNTKSDPALKRIGIVGGGPKGMYALERLLHAASQEQQALQIIWFNETADFGSGHNYSTAQPDNLLINYCIGNIDAWLREDQNEFVTDQLSLSEWIAANNLTDSVVHPTDFASRALVGCYLQDITHQLLLAKPANVHVSLVLSTVQDIAYEDQFKITLAKDHAVVMVDYLLLATGHCYTNVAPIKNSAQSVGQEYISSAYPIHRLDAIPEGVSVGIMGLGLTFIDICLHLTEGRGGVFTQDGKYIASGNEPILYPFSRSNLPIHPRGAVYGAARYSIRSTTTNALQELVNARASRQIDFQQEVLPVIEAEVRYAYYSTLLHTQDEEVIYQYIQNLSAEQLFSFEKLLFPAMPDSTNRHLATKKYIDESIARAKAGELQDPFMAAAAVWRELTPVLGELYNFGGLTPASQQYLDQQLWSACCRTSFGPPIANMQKITALAEAGIIQFAIPPNAEINYDSIQQHFEIGNPDEKIQLSYFIDGRIARSQLQRQNSPLYSRLAAQGMIDIFTNGEYQPGCIAIEQDGRTIALADGKEIPLYFYGTPTEGILFDNDSLSRVRNNTASPWADRILQLINEQTHEVYP